MSQCNRPLTPTNIDAVKQQVKAHLPDLKAKFEAGESVDNLVRIRSNFIDQLLIDYWQHFLGDCANRLALVAVGGYGRQELHPHSDIDLLILFNEGDLEQCRDMLEQYLTFLWDIGLNPGQSVRTIDDCVAESLKDISVTTNMLESRLLFGDTNLFDQMQQRTSPDHIWSAFDFYQGKLDEQKGRHFKFNDSAYNLEPNIKEGPGGLRDIQTINWVTQRYFRSRSLGELVNHAFLTKSEYRSLIRGQQFLWRIRFALHILTNRAEDRLLFDHQKNVASMLGYEDTDSSLGVEQLMQQYYRTVKEIQWLNEMLLQIFREAMDTEMPEVTPINERFRAVNNYLEITYIDVFKQNPTALLEMFLLLQKHAWLEGVKAATIRQVREDCYLINDEVRNDKQAQRLFMEILRQPRGITHQFRRMNRYGVLGAYIPAFDNIVGRMQYDLFHIYTVDQHTLFLVRNLRRFALDKHREELPFCNDVFKHIPKPELLYVAGLFHDIAKGRGGDHSKLGKKDAEEFCKRHDISRYDTHLVCWLVENHLLMSMTAQRKDIADSDVIHDFATQVGSLEYLDYLYLLTVADIRATSPKLWNTWKDSLLKELYNSTRRALRRGLRFPIDEEDKIKSLQHQARESLHAHGLTDEHINRIWKDISSDYFTRYSAEDSLWHTLAIASCPTEELPMVLLRPETHRGGAEIFIYSPDKKAIFAICAATLDKLGLNILDARIITTEQSLALISFQVLEEDGSPIYSLEREQHIANTLRHNLIQEDNASLHVDRMQQRQKKHFQTRTAVFTEEDPQHRYTILEIITHDRPGVLARIGQAFKECGVNVLNAKIATIGSRAEDIFYIVDDNNMAIESAGLLEDLKMSIIQHLET